jgi:hypothetical protein
LSDALPPRNPVGRRLSDVLRDRALWILVIGSLVQGGAVAILVRQLDREEKQRDAERAAWERQAERLYGLIHRKEIP